LPLLSPGQKQAPSPAEFGNAIGYVLSIKSRFSDKPGIYENFLAILQDYRNEKMGTTDVVDCLSSLFEDHPDLLKGFACFCPDSQAKERLEVAVKDLERQLPVKSLKQTGKDSNGQQSSGLGTEEGQSTSGSGAEDQSPPAGTLTQENPPVDSNTHTATGDFTIEYQLYSPSVQLDDMVIPEETKKRVFETISSSEDVKRKYYGQAIKCTNHGLGQVLLFYGYSGTGKTMLANAVATKLNKQILAVNFPNLDNRSAGPIIQALFKEARNKSAVLFFDECEFLGQDRTGGSSAINILGAELEQLDGLCILATNRPQELDEAIRRRISLAIEFRKPNPKMREELWKTLKPSAAQLDDNVCLGMLAKKYELTGGHIKNAWFQSLCIISQQGRDKITQEDLMQAASEQVTEQLSVGRIDRHVTPTHGLESVVLPPAVKESLSSIVQYTKAQSVLFGKWGFDKMHRSTSGISALFTGLPGTGKSMAAEAIGFDLERPLLFVNVAQLVSMWAGETGKNIEAAFADAKKMDAVLVFDEAEGLFGSRSESSEDCSRHDNMNVGLLLQYIENHPGVVIVITNMKNAIDNAFFRRFRFVLDFEMPDVSQREDLWKTLLPPECPLDSDVSLRELASRYAMCGGDIKNSIMRAATRAALRSDEEDRKVTMSDLTSACEAEMLKKGADRKTNLAMYS
jgi:SpoVK/Ycf46/Vps4 family AAA+-type ATPase